MIKVSAIIPVYNTSKYLDKCIESVLKQTLDNIEIIIINDGSNDNSDEIINKYLNNKSIRYYNRKNHGIGATRNFGIENAHGKYICFIDSDDYVDELMFEKMYNRCENDKLDVLICDYYENYEKQNKIKKINLISFGNTTLNKKPNLIIDINLSPWNKMYRKKLFDNQSIRFPIDLKYEDMPFVLKTFKEADKIGKINEAFNYYLIRDNTETTTMDRRVFDIFDILDIIRNYFSDNRELKKYIDTLIVCKITTYTVQQRNQKDKNIRDEFISKAFKYLKTYVPDYKNNMYFKNRNILKQMIEKSEKMTKMYCNLYLLIKKD